MYVSDSSSQPANRLAGETSPYLLQHAHNPVDWYSWGPEALQKARRENRPILLSIGYAACHWCHVMERESFEDHETARLMNERFVCIKVDREERPDLDSIYMDALTAMTGRGGWPMTMFLTPDAKPFFGGTYFPPDDRHGMPSFRRILDAVHDAWVNRQDEIGLQTAALVEHIGGRASAPARNEPLERSLLEAAVAVLEGSFDPRHGGFGPAPKFPQAPLLELLLRTSARGIGRSLEMLELTLKRMALNGMYDQIGGGFHRYSVDERWLVPHFEKMLYDNAQLARVYTKAWQLTGSGLYKRIAEETLDYLVRDMSLPSGPGEPAAFFASEDADSEGEEGRFYVWDPGEFLAIAPQAADYYGVTPGGNFEGRSILTAAGDDPPLAARDKLLRRRSSRIRPGRDEKILVSWNALAISAFAEASAAFGRGDFARRAVGTATFLLENATGGGRLMHSFKDGRAHVPGMLEDYAYLCEAMLTLWEVTFDGRWLKESRRLADETLRLFSDLDRGDFYSTGEDHEKLIVRPKELIDGATPSPNAVASFVLQKLAVLTGDKETASRGVDVLRSGHAYMAQAPQAAGTLLCGLDFYLSTPQEIVILGAGAAAEDLKREVWSRFLPNKVIGGAASLGEFPVESPLLEGKAPLDGSPTAFVCENYSCRAPTSDPEEFARQLTGSS